MRLLFSALFLSTCFLIIGPLGSGPAARADSPKSSCPEPGKLTALFKKLDPRDVGTQLTSKLRSYVAKAKEAAAQYVREVKESKGKRLFDLLSELDRRKLHFEHPSLWSYLVHELGLEESTAERRIRAASSR